MFRGLLRTLPRVDPVLRYLWVQPILPNMISFKIVLDLGKRNTGLGTRHVTNDCFAGILGWKNSTSTNKLKYFNRLKLCSLYNVHVR